MLMNEGTYSGVCKDIGMDRPDGKSSYLDIVFEITHYAENGEWVGMQSQDRHLRLYTSQAAWQYTERKLQILEFNGDFKNPQITTGGVVLECEHEVYEGKTREKWDLPYDGNRERQLPPDDELRTLSARYKSAIANTKKPAGSPSMPVTPPPVSGPPPIPPWDTESPF